MSYFHKAQNSLVLPVCPDAKHATFHLGWGGHLSPGDFISLLPFFSVFTKNFTVQYISWICLFVCLFYLFLWLSWVSVAVRGIFVLHTGPFVARSQ